MLAHVLLLLLAALCRGHPAPALEEPLQVNRDASWELAVDYQDEDALDTFKSKRSPLPLPELELLTRRRYLRREQAAAAGPSTVLPTVEYEFNLFREDRPTLGLRYSEQRPAAASPSQR